MTDRLTDRPTDQKKNISDQPTTNRPTDGYLGNREVKIPKIHHLLINIHLRPNLFISVVDNLFFSLIMHNMQKFRSIRHSHLKQVFYTILMSLLGYFKIIVRFAARNIVIYHGMPIQ